MRIRRRTERSRPRHDAAHHGAPQLLEIPSSACLAPSSMMYLAPDGSVRACCRSFAPIGNVAERSLAEIWNGMERRQMVDALAGNVFPPGCEPCGVECEVEGRERSYPVRFDRFAPSLAGRDDDGAGGSWPLRIEFNLSNACNLMCIQCDGNLSSSIRAHRERLPALPKAYGEAFFVEMEDFIPHLVEAQFAGGEPFLGRENYRIWELIERLNPELPCTVVTNATQWSDRIERIGSTLQMGYTFSLDAVTKETYELIRVGADHDAVMANLPRYMAMADGKGATVEINFCLMRQNHHEFGDLLLWAEELGVQANVSVVRHPEECSLASLEREELRRVVAGLAAVEDRVLPHLQLNRATWVEEVERLRRWAGAPPDTREQLWWSDAWSDPDARRSRGLVPILPSASSVDLAVLRVETPDVAAVEATLASWAADGRVHRLTADFEPVRDPDHLVVSLSDSMAAVLGCRSEELVGRPVQDVQAESERRFGPIVEVDPIRLDRSHREFSLRFRDADLRVAMLAEGDGTGRLVGVTVLVAVRPPWAEPGRAQPGAR